MNAEIYFNTVNYSFLKDNHKIEAHVSLDDNKTEYIYISLDSVMGHSRISLILEKNKQINGYKCIINIYEYKNDIFKRILTDNGFKYEYYRYINENVNLEELTNILYGYLTLEKENKFDNWFVDKH